VLSDRNFTNTLLRAAVYRLSELSRDGYFLLWVQVGVYGYAAYSASKFALRGLAEVLQQELIDRNIRLSLVYPPDTMTPGYLEGAFILLSVMVCIYVLVMNAISLFVKNILI
jgi:NAD(P)-dependent dehydrogenase (short-subunit alcohol dehydrogenase family)